MAKALSALSLCVLAAVQLGFVGGGLARQGPEPDIQSLARQVVGDLAARRFDRVAAVYDDAMAKAAPPDKLAAIWDAALSQFGSFQSVTGTDRDTLQGHDVVYVTCAFSKASYIIVLSFNARRQLAGLSYMLPAARAPWKAPDYVKPGSFQERPISLHSGPWDLPGTLTMPNRESPVPGVVLVHGSGPEDQDESIGPNKMFKDLAWGLASRGIAVLRYTKRSKQYGAASVDDFNAFTVKDETIDDARVAVSLLAAVPGVNPKRIFVAGHSQGAYLAPRIASGDGQIAGIILLAGNTRPLEDLVVDQVRYEASLNGPLTDASRKQIDAAEESAREFRDTNLKPGMTVNLLGAKVPASYVLDLRNYRPGDVAAALSIPIYVLQGARDYQVRVVDFEGWKKSLANRSSAAFKLYPALNHLFMPGSGPSSPTEYLNPGHVPEEVISDIASWIAR